MKILILIHKSTWIQIHIRNCGESKVEFETLITVINYLEYLLTGVVDPDQPELLGQAGSVTESE